MVHTHEYMLGYADGYAKAQAGPYEAKRAIQMSDVWWKKSEAGQGYKAGAIAALAEKAEELTSLLVEMKSLE